VKPGIGGLLAAPLLALSAAALAGWQEWDERLFALAGEVSKAIGGK
jgi:hypothetical protein